MIVAVDKEPPQEWRLVRGYFLVILWSSRNLSRAYVRKQVRTRASDEPASHASYELYKNKLACEAIASRS